MRSKLIILFLSLSAPGMLLSGQIRINEILADNHYITDNPNTGIGGDWIELVNQSSQAEAMIGLFMSDDPANLAKWKFPSNLQLDAGQFLVLRADGTGVIDDELHLNFKLDIEGECIYLYSVTEGVIDSINYPRQYTNDSYGLDEGGAYAFFDGPTPGAANNEAKAYRLAPAPIFQKPAGFYPSGLSLRLSGSPDGTIRYTRDGSIPEFGDSEFNGSIDIRETTTIRARQWINGTEPGETATATYVVGTSYNLPVVALATDPINLWDDEQGIHVVGTNGAYGNCDNGVPKNWNQDWEVGTSFEYFDLEGNLQLQKNGGVKIHGGCSRNADLKSLAFIVRNSYGSNQINYPFFRGKDVDDFKALVLRNSGNDNSRTYFRDAAIMATVKGMNLDLQAYEPMHVYLNGDYWGIMNLREKTNEHWVTTNYGIPRENLDFIENGWQVFAGSLTAYEELQNYFNNNSLVNGQAYQWVEDRLDIDSYIDYLIAQMFFANKDWPGNNQKCWRDASTGGKFRYLLYDTDFGLGLYDSNPAADMFSFTTNPDGPGWPNPSWATLPMRRLFENEEFRETFIQRYLMYLNTTLSGEHINSVIDSLKQNLDPDFHHHVNRWHIISSLASWEDNVRAMKSYAIQRPAHVLNNMRNFFNLGSIVSFQVDGMGEEGSVIVNGVKIPAEGLSGSYISGSRMNLNFEAAPGYKFSHWEVSTSFSSETEFIPAASIWKYNDSGIYPGDSWKEQAYNDAAWEEGAGELGYGDNNETTQLDFGGDEQNKHISYYFRQKVNIENVERFSSFELDLMRDDGAVIYVNGQEAQRVNMPDGDILFETLASNFAGGTDESSYFNYSIDPSFFLEGENVIAVEIHQSSATSSDISFDLKLKGKEIGEAEKLEFSEKTIALMPGGDIHVTPVTEIEVRELDLLINEIMASNSGAYFDEYGDDWDWVEVYNDGSESVDMAGLWFTDSLEIPNKWQIPYGLPEQTSIAPGEYLVYFASGNPLTGPRYLDFKLSAGGEEIGLSYKSGPNTIWIDSLNYGQQPGNLSLGRYPDGADNWVSMRVYTPEESNIVTALDLNRVWDWSISLYPNPARDYVNLVFSPKNPGHNSEMQIRVYDLTGRQVMDQHLELYGSEHQERIDVSYLPEGIYIMKLDDRRGSYSIRFIKGN